MSWPINSESHMGINEARDINCPEKRKCSRITNCSLNPLHSADHSKECENISFFIHLPNPVTYWKNSWGGGVETRLSRSFYKGKIYFVGCSYFLLILNFKPNVWGSRKGQ